MRSILLIALLMIFIVPEILLAYEPGTFNLIGPTNLEKGQKEFKVQHRFKGKISEKPLDTFFGMDLAGVNVGISLRYMVWSNLELNVSRIWNEKEYETGVSYAHSFPGTLLRSQANIQFFDYREFDFEKNEEERKNGAFGLFSLRSEPAFGRIVPVVNIGYDGYNKKLGAGLGFDVTVLQYLGIIQRVSAIGEYYPTKIGSENENSFAFGIRIETYSHHFDFIVSKNSEIGVRRLMSGAIPAEGLRFGFNIKRLL